jgi:hypothetical protein
MVSAVGKAGALLFGAVVRRRSAAFPGLHGHLSE